MIKKIKKTMKDKQWSEWVFFSDIKKHTIPGRAGVYIIRCIENNSKPFKIYRAYGIDENGTLSIGESSNLENRLHGFYRTIQPFVTRSNHAASWYYVSFKYNRFFKEDNLQFRYKVTSNKKGAEKQEFILLTGYRNQFLDLPPLNNNPGKYPEDWEKVMKSITGREPLDG